METATYMTQCYDKQKQWCIRVHVYGQVAITRVHTVKYCVSVGKLDIHIDDASNYSSLTFYRTVFKI